MRSPSSDESTPGTVRSAINWAFQDRRTGRLVVAQFPNIPLAVWIVATVLRWFIPRGTANTVLGVIATVGLGVWAGDEIIRGVNPWRRFLGTSVLAGLILSLSISA